MKKILYRLFKNYLQNGRGKFRAAVKTRGSVDQAGLIQSMIYRGSSINESDILGVLRDYYDAIYHALLNGENVNTPLVNLSLSIRGNFEDAEDSFDPERHELVAVTNAGLELKEKIARYAELEKEETVPPLPNPRQCRSLSNGPETNQLLPGKLAQVTGRRLDYDPADPEQGLFLTNKGTTVRVEPEGKITPSELVFLVPPELAPGEYTLKVRAKFGKGNIRTGELPTTLSVLAA